ncbi:hypothetical protein SFMTTN_0264 [Sulfuriferula multivorans]|uniref:Uncharacterized protein n=1 Tax=Sulfuriferula multivorans TaxID=1559896 RepID=A0A401J9Y4_9PROT|nr:hypothetical protein [Sulfuriferula multivorans]GBL44468.1 hypothetical protein SFMTTN_0264 [Sulfuriferula multivorans]
MKYLPQILMSGLLMLQSGMIAASTTGALGKIPVDSAKSYRAPEAKKLSGKVERVDSATMIMVIGNVSYHYDSRLVVLNGTLPKAGEQVDIIYQQPPGNGGRQLIQIRIN